MNADTQLNTSPSSTADAAPNFTPIPRLLLSPKEAALALRISPRLLWSLTKSGEIPCVRLSRCVRYAPAALQRWIDETSAEK
jgi:hypothetical protein